MSRVLIVDDEQPVRRALERILIKLECEVVAVENGVEAQAKLAEAEFDLVITDLRMPLADGFVVLRAARALQPAPPVVVLSGHGTAADCVRAMRAGASDFMSKPFHPAELRQVVRAALQSRSREPATEASPQDDAGFPQAALVGDSPRLHSMLNQIERVADTDAAVLLVGERYTGKQAIARFLHAISYRAGGPFITVACGAQPEARLEADLLGDAADPGKLSAADGGTLLLTEVDRIDPALRGRISSRIAERRRPGRDGRASVDVRLVIDVDVEPEQDAGESIVAALESALGAVIIEVPSVRERSEDLPLLIEYFVQVANRRLKRRVNPENLLKTLGTYPWPGNLKELENRIAKFITGSPPEPTEAAPAQPNALAVPIERLSVTLLLRDGSRHEAVLPRDPGRPVEELFESKESFVPVRQEGKTRIYLRSALSCITMREPTQGGEHSDGLPRNRRAVRVHLVSGVVLEGELRYVLVEGRARVTDVLNEMSPSFELHENELVHHVAKAHVVWVEER